MGPEQSLYAALIFENRVRSATGFDYENLFHEVMLLKHPSGAFIPIEPYGKLGDRKNDGYIPSQKTFFQVYAPKSPSEKLAAAASKAKTDFAGLRTHWQARCPIEHYRFVFNDGFTGSVAPLEFALLEIEKTHSVTARVFLTAELRATLLSLSDNSISQVLRSVIPEAGVLPDADYTAVREVVNHVMNLSEPLTADGVLSSPTLGDKIAFNRLSPYVGSLLSTASHQAVVVKDYFGNRGGYLRQALRNQLAAIYDEEKSAAAQSQDTPDQLFFRVLQRMTPPSSVMKKAVQDAALVVMAFYFESCDLFEVPHATA